MHFNYVVHYNLTFCVSLKHKLQEIHKEIEKGLNYYQVYHSHTNFSHILIFKFFSGSFIDNLDLSRPHKLIYCTLNLEISLMLIEN